MNFKSVHHLLFALKIFFFKIVLFFKLNFEINFCFQFFAGLLIYYNYYYFFEELVMFVTLQACYVKIINKQMITYSIENT